MKVMELLHEIKHQELVLPEFQREYVWTKEQAKQLMVSLLKEYPIGGLLFWNTPKPPELKNIHRLPEKMGIYKVILDGQQRLTTLYLLIIGEIPPYYTEKDLHTDPRDLYFNLETTEFHYYQTLRMKDNPRWISVREAFKNTDIHVIKIAQQVAINTDEALQLAETYMKNLQRLEGIKNIEIPTQLVPTHADLDEAIDIFDRVNSQGTKLTDAELALTHVTGKWAQTRRVFKNKIQELDKRYFYFDLGFFTRAMTGVITRHALFENIHTVPKGELEEGWNQLNQILDYLVNILPSHAFIHSTEDLNSTNVLIPVIVYLSLNSGKFPDEMSLKHALNWIYAAHTWARFTSQTDQRLEHDVLIVVRESSPWDSLREQIIDQRGRISLQTSDLVGRGTQHPMYRMVYILVKAMGAVDWFNGMPLGVPQGKSYKIHSHHIFPVSLLYSELYDSANHLHRQKVNEIANRAFLTADSNLMLSNKRPEEYLHRIEESYPGALAKQCIPMNPDLWRVERYEDFLEARRELLTRKLNDYLNSLIVEPVIVTERPISQIIEMGESITVEFKTTLQWDVRQGRQNRELRHSVLKTVAAFLNTEGGTLLIGVEDDGHVFGLESDLKLVGLSRDRFQQLLASLISDSLGPQFAHLIRTRFEEVEGKIICVIDVDKSPEPVFLVTRRGREFYIRINTTSRSLDPQQAHEYIQMNWQ